ncbi:MAG: helix-turn-helix domain-containing protein [Pseudomonadota bacterium]
MHDQKNAATLADMLRDLSATPMDVAKALDVSQSTVYRWLDFLSLQVALIEIASPDDDLVGIADVIDRRDLAAGKLFRR